MKNIIKEIKIDLSLKKQELPIPMGSTLLEKVIVKQETQHKEPGGEFLPKPDRPAYLLCHVEVDEELAYETTVTILIVKSNESFELTEEDDIEYLDTVVSRGQTYHIGVVLPQGKEE